jgi:hypothetical protein
MYLRAVPCSTRRLASDEPRMMLTPRPVRFLVRVMRTTAYYGTREWSRRVTHHIVCVSIIPGGSRANLQLRSWGPVGGSISGLPTTRPESRTRFALFRSSVYISTEPRSIDVARPATENREFTWVDTPDLKYSRDAKISYLPRRVGQFQRRQSGKGLSTKEAPVCGTFPYAPWRFSF